MRANDCVPACQEYVFVLLSEVTFVTFSTTFCVLTSFYKRVEGVAS